MYGNCQLHSLFTPQLLPVYTYQGEPGHPGFAGVAGVRGIKGDAGEQGIQGRTGRNGHDVKPHFFECVFD